jgi:hypothetical protein
MHRLRGSQRATAASRAIADDRRGSPLTHTSKPAGGPG